MTGLNKRVLFARISHEGAAGVVYPFVDMLENAVKKSDFSNLLRP
jgi:hypothetical protein